MPRRHVQPPRADVRPAVSPHAAGLGSGSEEIWACVPEDRDDQPVRSFGTFTPDLLGLAEWRAACQIETVAMASTGVEWIPVDEIREARGCNVYLVKAHHLKHGPGRKSDSKDGQWMQYLHTCGVLRGSFRPEAELGALRASVRHRARLRAYRAAPIRHLQKALHQRKVPLPQGLTDITGVTGRAIIRALAAGERDPVQLARCREPPCASRTEDLAKALPGHSQPAHVLALTPALALYEAYTEQVREGAVAIEQRFQAIKPVGTDALPPLNRGNKHRTHKKNAPGYDARGLLYQLTGGTWSPSLA